MNPGSNNPCICGSGKDFANCCQKKDAPEIVSRTAPSGEELAQLNNLFKAGDFARVEAQSNLLTERFPDCAQAWKLLGISRHLQGKDGLPALRKTVGLRPTDGLAHNNLANASKDLGLLEDAIESYRRALRFQPDLAGIHYNLGLTLMGLGRFDEAILSFRQTSTLDPRFAEAHNDLGNALRELGQLENALASYRKALSIKPTLVEAHNNLGNVLKDLGRLEDSLASYRQALSIKADYDDARCNMLFVLNYASNYASTYCLEQAQLFGRIAARKAKRRFTSWRCKSFPTRLRIGFVSGDLRTHPVGRFLESVVNQLGASQLELVAYPTQFQEDALTARIKPHFAAWKPLAGLSDEAAARLIHNDGIDVLFDLSGHTAHNRLGVFAWKPAPVQVSWLGYFATTGLQEMDFILADKTSVPDSAWSQFTESVYYLPDTRLCFTPPQPALPVSPLPALATGEVTFGCFQNLAKIGDNVLEVWGQLLARIPDAALRMQCPQLRDASVRVQLTERLQHHGIDPARVSLFGKMSYSAYLEAHAEVDVLLDTFPYPGGTTTCEGLFMGVPTLTLAGNSLLGRQGASLLAAAGLKEWISSSSEEYIAKGIALTRDLSALAELRSSLRTRLLASPLFDAGRFARNFEAAVWSMWKVSQHKLLS